MKTYTKNSVWLVIQQVYEAILGGNSCMKLDQIKSSFYPPIEMQTFHLLLDKSLSHINKQCIRRIKNISAAPPRITINCVPEAKNV